MVSAKTVTKKESDKGEKQDYGHSLLVEIAWEVCNQVGGIYTVIRSKVPSVTRKKKDDYLLIGPLLNQDVSAEFEDISRPLQYGIYGKAVKTMRAKGYEVRFGRWLVTGRPLVILINPLQGFEQLQTIKDHLYKDHGIAHRNQDDLYHQVLAFSHLVTLFFEILNRKNREKRHVIAHFHEWMTVASVFSLARKRWPLKTIFTTHATLLGRYIAMNDKEFYKKLPNYDWEKEAEKYDILAVTQLERKGAECCDVFTTVSEVTSLECKHLLGREADWVLPNGLNIKRFAAYHEVQNMHQEFKEEIHEFVMGHFFQSYSFNLDKTLYFFTSGRYEFLNKGFDLTLEALQILNKMMIKAKSNITVVMFFITRRPVWSVNPDVLHSRAVMEEIRQNCDSIIKQVGKNLFLSAAASDKDHRLPDLNELVDDYWRLRYRRTLQSWKGDSWPIIVTHNLVDDVNDEILSFLRKNNMINSPDDKVKIVYHPDFINPTNPLFGIEYADFVRGCHLGIFPSYYEPWGYTPLESIALGVPTVTSDLSGFGDYVLKNVKNPDEKGVFVLERYKKYNSEIAEKLAGVMFDYVNKPRSERMIARNKAEDLSESFDWDKLISYYESAYNMKKKS